MLRTSVKFLFLEIIMISHFITLATAEDLLDFRDEYTKASANIVEASDHVKGRVKLSTSKRDTGGKVVRKTIDQGHFASSGQFGKLELSADRSTGNQKRMIDYVFCLADDRFFTLSKKQSESGYSVETFGSVPKPGSKPSEYKPIDYKIYIGLFLKSAHRYFDSELSRILNPAIIESFEANQIRTDGKNLLRISFKLKADPNQSREFDLEPEFGYRIVRSSSSYLSRVMDSTKIEYDETIPYFPKRITQFTPQLEVICEFSDLRFESTPANEFEPGFYGVPNFASETSQSFFHMTILFVSVAAVSLLLWRRRPQRIAK